MRASKIRKFLIIIVLFFPSSWLIYLITDPYVGENASYAKGQHPYEIVPPDADGEAHPNEKATRAIFAELPKEAEAAPGNIRNEVVIAPPHEAHRNVVASHVNVLNPPGQEHDGHVHENLPADEIRQKMEAEKVLKPPLPPKSEVAKADPRKNPPSEKFEYGPQSPKLKEIGGYVMKKMPPGFYENVTLPRFVSAFNIYGLGEGGSDSYVPDKNLTLPEVKKEIDEGWKKNSFNQFVSDMVSVHRTIPDGRSEACKKQALGYSKHLPDVSVVIIFHNEAFSVLLRSVHSLLDRTPKHLLREIMLVDDFSSMDHLKAPLEKYFNDFPRVKIIRCTRRQGLTRARLLGFHASTAPIVVFLDSHIECFPKCLLPLIQRVHEQPTAVVYPSIEGISARTLSLRATIAGNLGIFSWKDMTFNWAFLPQYMKDSRANDSVPIQSPTMPGGLFAISRKFFEKLGTYDPGLDYWGGENIELSFKAWMCGGRVELVTCSHIGHIFRSSNPIKWSTNLGHKNSVRVAEVWMDDFKNYFYERLNFDLGNYGNVTDRKELRKRLGCKSFKWYLQNVYPFVVLPNDVLNVGEIRSDAYPRCIDSMAGSKPAPRMYACHGMGYNQHWVLYDDGRLVQEEWRICAHEDKRVVLLKTHCRQGDKWIYDGKVSKNIKHLPSGLCLTSSVTNETLSLQNCTLSRWQKWMMPTRRKDINFPTLE